MTDMLVWALVLQITFVPLIAGVAGWRATDRDFPLVRRIGFAAGLWLAASLALGFLAALAFQGI